MGDLGEARVRAQGLDRKLAIQARRASEGIVEIGWASLACASGLYEFAASISQAYDQGRAQGGPYKIGRRFGPYTLEAYLGSGAFKSVYKARNEGDVAPQPIVALGFPHHQDKESIAELAKEFAVVSRLVHPNILRVYSIERESDVSLLVMEHVDGGDLRDRLRDRGCLPQDEALRYVGLVCEALDYAHAAHVLHRDVRPDNVLLASDNTPKLLDFGVARLLARTSQKASTNIGTVEYMAPEQPSYQVPDELQKDVAVLPKNPIRSFS